jgi:hypothetical protein
MSGKKPIELIQQTPEYVAVQHAYGDRCAKRSGVPLINHINEGIAIIFELMQVEGSKAGWSTAMTAARAYCLHPLFQHNDDLIKVYAGNMDQFSPRMVMLAMEYRARANEWLSDKVVDASSYSYNEDNTKRKVVERYERVGEPTPGVLPEVRMMLVADKVQNYKDFLAHHYGTHERSEELNLYFHTWLEALGIDGATFDRLRAAT